MRVTGQMRRMSLGEAAIMIGLERVQASSPTQRLNRQPPHESYSVHMSMLSKLRP